MTSFKSVFVFIFIAVVFQSIAFSQMAPDFGAPGKQKARLNLKYGWDAFHESDESYVSSQTEGFLYFPVYQTENSTYALTTKSYNLGFNNLVSNSDFVPVNDFYSVQYGLAWSYEEADKNTWAVAANYGSASDKPFDGAWESSIDVTLTRKIVTSPTTSWMYFLNYSNNRQILNGLPLPGFAYVFVEEDKTSGGAVGLPFVSYWLRPSEKLFLSALYLFPSKLNLQAGYMLWGPLQGNFKLEHGQQTFFRANREDKNEQIYYETSKAAVSLKAFMGKDMFIEMEYARIFDRQLYDGTSAFKATSERLRMPNEWQVTTSLQAVF